jgi:hypothetical protein
VNAELLLAVGSLAATFALFASDRLRLDVDRGTA